MKYVTIKRFKREGIGGNFNIPYGTELELHDDGKLYYSDKPVCVSTSFAAHQHFSRNDDGNGLERGKLTSAIAFDERRIEITIPATDEQEERIEVVRFTPEEHEMLRRDWNKFLKSNDVVLFNHEFFNADIDELKELAAALNISV